MSSVVFHVDTSRHLRKALRTWMSTPPWIFLGNSAYIRSMETTTGLVQIIEYTELLRCEFSSCIQKNSLVRCFFGSCHHNRERPDDGIEDSTFVTWNVVPCLFNPKH
ncbi:hypothetical protein Naga_101886g1 [Nannochloropsis gaditana]|uniref:Uncharacterized protein n=1 Tax=Nannochloropsis gaditana TaxID=72520 RepID=W7T9B7_9STRA|nr:hypothetical protein Naga_101886g1 [Nannochloropsis gaditana]